MQPMVLSLSTRVPGGLTGHHELSERKRSSFPTCTRNGHRHRVICTRGCIDTIDAPDDENGVAGNMYRIEINT